MLPRGVGGFPRPPEPGLGRVLQTTRPASQPIMHLGTLALPEVKAQRDPQGLLTPPSLPETGTSKPAPTPCPGRRKPFLSPQASDGLGTRGSR